jgi:hypothetical protein
VIGLDAEAVRRNFLITQCYHDLSAEFARVLGGENANWCTFATWASQTAGGFIREDEIPAAFRLARAVRTAAGHSHAGERGAGAGP